MLVERLIGTAKPTSTKLVVVHDAAVVDTTSTYFENRKRPIMLTNPTSNILRLAGSGVGVGGGGIGPMGNCPSTSPRSPCAVKAGVPLTEPDGPGVAAIVIPPLGDVPLHRVPPAAVPRKLTSGWH